MKIGIIGLGLVGKAIRHGFARIGHDIAGYDIALPETTLKDALSGEVVFVCVPTPSASDGSCDTSIVENVIGQINDAGYPGLVAIKSTVEPGTTDKLIKRYPRLRLAFCPEFLREKATFTDFVEQHDVCVIGTYSTEDFELLKDFVIRHNIDKIHFYSLNPQKGTVFEKSKHITKEYHAEWIAKTRIAFPKLDIQFKSVTF